MVLYINEAGTLTLNTEAVVRVEPLARPGAVRRPSGSIVVLADPPDDIRAVDFGGRR